MAKFIDVTTKFDRCYDCGKHMMPDYFPMHPALPEFHGYAAGEVIDGNVWVRCPDGHRGGWRAVEITDHI